MIALAWATGLLRRRRVAVFGLATAVMLTTSFVGLLGAFVTFARSEVARRAGGDVDVDWQVQVAHGARPSDILDVLRDRPGVRSSEVVGYGDVSHLDAATGGTVQTTGAGKIVGLSPTYRTSFPGEIRPLVGSSTGVLIAQQTAANLHAGPGTTVTVTLPNGVRTSLRVDGVVDLPRADSFFQSVGAAPGAGPQAPPDNVLIVPLERWRSIVRPEVGTIQLHVRINRALPPDPAAALARLVEIRRNDEARLTGTAVIGDNLAARLDSARKDAAYGQLLFLFLGVPGALLGIAIIVLVGLAGAERRRAEHALLRARGATPRTVATIAATEGMLSGVIGAIAGAVVTVVGAERLWHAAPTSVRSIVIASIVGIAASVSALLVPSIRASRLTSVRAARVRTEPRAGRAAARFTLAILFGAIASAAVWYTTRRGYEVVVAPEGVPTVSVSYLTLVGPAAAWPSGLLFLAALAGPALIAFAFPAALLLRRFAGAVSSLIPPWLEHVRGIAVRSVLLVALAIAFAISTAIFDASFAAQSHVDAELTNGADVSAQAPPGVDLSAAQAPASHVAGVTGTALMRHRFAYVGNDLQDMYGITPSIAHATTLSDAYFAGGHASRQVAALRRQTDGVFVAEETIKEYQLHPGDLIRLRLLDAVTHRYVPVDFHVVGVVREFPTAPTDSFVVANTSYIALATHSSTAETLLVRTRGRSPAAVARDLGRIVPNGARVQDVVTQRRIVASGLVAVDVRGLALVESGFALFASIVGVGLLFALTFTERRRSFLIFRSLRVAPRQIASIAGAEAGAVVVIGIASGAILGGAVGWILVKVLRGLFDPPPAHPIVPWLYVAVVIAAVIVAATAATMWAIKRSSTVAAGDLRAVSL